MRFWIMLIAFPFAIIIARFFSAFVEGVVIGVKRSIAKKKEKKK